MCNKNFGSAVMQRDTYTKQVLSDYLQDKYGTYQELSSDEA